MPARLDGAGAATVPAAVLTGHVDRVALFASLMEDVQQVDGLGRRGVLGSYAGRQLAVVGTGMGGPATVRAAVQVTALGCRILVRAGGAGPVCDGPVDGDLVVATAAVRHEGTSQSLLRDTRPAVADPHLVECLRRRAEESGRTWVGVVHTKDSFFGEIDAAASPMSATLVALWATWRALGVLASEMEAAALFAFADRAGLAAGAVLRINDVHRRRGNAGPSELELCRVALAATSDACEDDDD